MPTDTRTGAPEPAAQDRTAPAKTAGRPLGLGDVALTDGLLGHWQRRNAAATLPHAVEQVRAAGVLDNFRRVAEQTEEPFRGGYPFADTDAYKTLEAAAYELARGGEHDSGEHDAGRAAVRAFYEEAVHLIEGAQGDDGYLSSFHQGTDTPVEPWADLAGGHELYNLGHLIQGALAAARRLGDDRLLNVARRFADLVVDRFGEEGRAEYCGHPQVETALVELYRETGHEPYLRQAELFVERRGSGLFAGAPFGPAYYADHAPLRDLDTVTGHAVRMVYLAAGATDVAIERGDTARTDHLLRLWDDMVRTKSYVTGGIGSRHSDEAFGDRYELPSERAYAETCAAIGTMQWGWRLFLATGSAAVLDHVERVLYNGFAAGVSLEGTRFFYDNPLQRRPDHTDGRPADPAEPLRRRWFGCACCPPNAARWISGLQDHVALETPDGLTVALLTACRIRSAALTVDVVTDYPWDGRVTVRVLAARDEPATLTLRVPAWATTPRVTVDGAPIAGEPGDSEISHGWLRLTRAWRPGQEVVLDLPMRPTLVVSHPAVDATRGAVAVVRGPVVHCLERADSPAPLDELVVHTVGAGTVSERTAGGDSPSDDPVLRHAVTAHVSRRPAPSDDPYPAADRTDPPTPSTTTPVALVPYHLWANREPGAMRVWLRHT
ncbi:glycoside hydrolase family 127 protein [Promicromonospora iranensis]|uniref:glycoside hydrolase family 127 protein n=1 Tax=Promicromonospora iranensis TaxID=1105144 RepID=UPI0023A94324|nr:beta-L-arabinofuranosidase domain-containing protein [Promicromonospora iranensis]